MKTVLIIAIILAGLGVLFVIFKLLKKSTKFVKKLPKNHFYIFIIYATLGLTGLMLKEQIAPYPILLGILILLVSLISGIVFTNKIFYVWEKTTEKTLVYKIAYISGLMITGLLTFALSFLLAEHRGLPRPFMNTDLVLYLPWLITIMLLPSVILWMWELWNKIPTLQAIKHVFQLPVGGSPPFIESGGVSLSFQFIIPLNYRSKEIWRSKVAVPFNKTLAEVFHYKLHEHNVVKRFVKKIEYAEDNQRAKVYGWSFYKTKKVWWGWFTKKLYLNPNQQVGKLLSQHDSVYVERVKTWK